MNEDALLRHVAKRIAEVRRGRGMTQEDLELLETATRNVQRIEAGQNLTLRMLGRIAKALGVRPAALLED